MNWAAAFSGTGYTRALPLSSETNYWIDDLGSTVTTDSAELTIIADIIFYWCDDLGNDVIDDTGSITSLLHVE
tara:strand:+ start:733 stop:951 length:219 start_codon:yes stop_codon:yes gene_type:complete